MEVDQSTTALSESETFSGTAYGLPWTNQFTALPPKFTTSLYLKVKTGSALVRNNLSSGNGGMFIDGVKQSSSVALTNADGWKHLMWHNVPNPYAYNYDAWAFKTPLSSEVWVALPCFAAGFVKMNPLVGVVMNDKMFG